MIFNWTVWWIIITFMASSIPKIFSLKYFIHLVDQYDILPKYLALLYGVFLPFVEVLGAGLLLSNTTFFYGIIVLQIILLSFAYAVYHVISNNKILTCGCYGRFLDAKVDKFTLNKIITLFLLATLSLYLSTQYEVQYSLHYIGMGIFLTLLLLLSQWIWNFHQDALRILRYSGTGSD
ncbi:MauE/DoxX family redox-associated membrane protein [Alkalibacillus silvisoli]|uniref:MauE/DoxX family redox-associated membrane protein n=1 Tax=Alkalibacillus silvisoli TaxID=392823 RepID=UPI0031CE8780